MHSRLYKRPNKARTMARPQDREAPEKVLLDVPEIIAVDRATECHVTPDIISQKMVWYLEAETDHKILEPEAGTGNLIEAILSEGFEPENITGIERHTGLYNNLKSRFNLHRELSLVNSCFLGYAELATEPGFDRILMNPPFRQAKQHIAAALKLLVAGGVLVALVPVTFKHPQADLLEELPNDIFASAKVFTKIIRIEV